MGGRRSGGPAVAAPAPAPAKAAQGLPAMGGSDRALREFPVKELLGAEEVLARLWREHTKSKMYKALTFTLTEIVSRRTWVVRGELNGLALKRQTVPCSR